MFLVPVIFLILATVQAGCGPRNDYVIADLRVTTVGWDSVRIEPVFARQGRLGGEAAVAPDSLSVYMLDAAYDTLYAGADLALFIPDADLGSGERVSIDVCGRIRTFVVCEQTSVLASPKRIQVEPELDYPLEQNVQRGTYTFPFKVERQVYGQTEAWEEIHPGQGLRGSVRAVVEGRENEPVQVSFLRTSGRFDLAGDANYRDFKFALDSALRSHQQATIRFDVFVDIPGFDEPVATLTRAVRVKTNEERQVEVARIAQHAADRAIERIDPYVDERRSVAYVDAWQFNAIRGLYTVDMEIRWSGTTFVRNAYRIQGTLEAAEDGSSARFTLVDGDRNGRRRWESATSGSTLDLGTLDTGTTPAAGGGSVPGLLVLEAERFDASEPVDGQSWTRLTDIGGYFGDGAVVAMPDRKRVVEAPGGGRAPELRYEIAFDRPGVYYIWLRVWAGGNDDNSVHLGLDGSPQRSSLRIETQRYGRWAWTDDRRGRRSRATLVVDRPGRHTLHLWMREDGTYVDQIFLTPDPDFVPGDEPYAIHPDPDAGDSTEAVVVPSFRSPDRP
jgi:hypothetical protein